MARRGRGEGTIRRRSDGRWEAIATLGEQRRSFYGKTRAEVKQKLTEAQHDYATHGQFIGDSRQTVEQYFASWMETKRPPELRASTWRDYDCRIRKHILPAIGSVRLTQLTPQHVQQAVATWTASGLAPGTIMVIFTILHEGLHAAVRLGLVLRNVTEQVERPRRVAHEMRPLSADEAQRLLAYVAAHDADDRYGQATLLQLALSTGMRRGELLALKWRDVDLDGGRLSVVASLNWAHRAPVTTEPKTKRSRRQIALAPQVVTSLREHRHRQRLLRVAAGPAWQEEFDAVFSDALGFPLHPAALLNRFKRLLTQAGVPPIRFHDLRHTCATLLLAQGVNPKIVSEMLGHSSVAITMDVYSHVLPHMQEEAARAVSRALGW